MIYLSARASIITLKNLRVVTVVVRGLWKRPIKEALIFYTIIASIINILLINFVSADHSDMS